MRAYLSVCVWLLAFTKKSDVGWTLFSLVESADVSDILAASINKEDDCEWNFYENRRRHIPKDRDLYI
jgi:hypothetical protein